MKKDLALPLLPQAGRVGPGRWEVAVFRFPEEPQVRYIKRLVGMPDEIIRIQQGDIWRRPSKGSEPFLRLRRPIAHQLAMQALVYDDSHRAGLAVRRPGMAALGTRLQRAGPRRNQEPTPVTGPDRTGQNSAIAMSFPTPSNGKRSATGRPLDVPPRPILVTDFSSYNTDVSPRGRLDRRSAARPWFQPHWVGDLTVSCRVDVRQADRTVAPRADQGGRVQSVRSRSDDRPGDARADREQ